MLSKFTVLLAVFGSLQTALAQIPFPINAALYDQIKRYTFYAGSSYGAICPTPPYGSTIVKQWGSATSGTAALLLYSSSANELVLSFKGTSTPADFNTDFDFGLVAVNIPGVKAPSSAKIHTGFQKAYNTISSDVLSTVRSTVAQYPGATFVVTGHSLGGALASLATAQLRASNIRLTTFTYGEPRNGNGDWSTYVDGLQPTYYRVTHFNDGVPNLPPTLLGYKHHGTEYWERANTTNSASTTLRCGKGEPAFCVTSQNAGSNPINGAHIQYSDVLLASALYNPGCGYVAPTK